jgi:general secretion pathway protein F
MKTAVSSLLNNLNKVHFSYKDREYASENIALLLRAAVPIGEALESLCTTSSSKSLRDALTTMQTDIEAGRSLADAMEHSGLANGQTLALVRLGEQSGHLVDNLELAAKQEEKRRMFKAKVRSALIYPSFVLGLTLIVGLGVSWLLLPKLAETFKQLHIDLPLISRVMIDFGLFLKNYGFIAVPLCLVALVALWYVLFIAPRTRHIGLTMLYYVPGIGRLLKEVEIAQFGYLSGTLLEAGLSITQTMRLQADASTSPRYRHFYEYLVTALDDGYSLRECLSRYPKSPKLLPPAVQQMIIAGERSGSLPEVFKTFGKTYEQKADITTQNLQSIMEPVLLVIVWIGVMLVAVGIIVPIYSLVGGLS